MRFAYVFELFIPSLIAKDISKHLEIVRKYNEFDLRFKDTYPAIHENIVSIYSILGELCKKVYSVHLHNIKLSKPSDIHINEFITCLKSLCASFPSLQIITVHCGSGGLNYLLRNLKTIDEILSKEDLKIKLACENMPNLDSNLNSIEDIREFASEMKKMKRIGLCIDTSHIPSQYFSLNRAHIDEFDKSRNIGYEYSLLISKFLEHAGEKLYHVHISDFIEEETRKDHLIPGSGILNWHVILETLRKIEYQGKCVIELTIEECNTDNFEKVIFYLSKIHSQFAIRFSN